MILNQYNIEINNNLNNNRFNPSNNNIINNNLNNNNIFSSNNIQIPKRALFKCNKCGEEIDVALKKDHLLSHRLDENEKRVANMVNRNNNRNNNVNNHNNNNRQNQNRNNNVPPRMQIVRIRSFNNNDNRQPHIRIRRNNNENVHRFLLINNLGINNHIRNRNLNNHNHLNFPEIVIDDVNKLDDANKSCTICLDEFKPNEKVTALPCLHYFHKNCIKKWLERKKDCPVCKFELTQENINQKMNNIFH